MLAAFKKLSSAKKASDDVKPCASLKWTDAFKCPSDPTVSHALTAWAQLLEFATSGYKADGALQWWHVVFLSS